MPQLAGSFFKSTQVEPHFVLPPPQVSEHVPAEHASCNRLRSLSVTRSRSVSVTPRHGASMRRSR
jgi:hypothetical protein